MAENKKGGSANFQINKESASAFDHSVAARNGKRRHCHSGHTTQVRTHQLGRLGVRLPWSNFETCWAPEIQKRYGQLLLRRTIFAEWSERSAVDDSKLFDYLRPPSNELSVHACADSVGDNSIGWKGMPNAAADGLLRVAQFPR